MEITTVLFDLDGTLLPMDQDTFVQGYFRQLAAQMAPHGYEAKPLTSAIWAGTAAMMENNGSRTNEQAFWEKFSAAFGERAPEARPLLEEFYRTDFQKAKAFCGFEPLAAEAVRQIRQAGLCAVLATNPLFPAAATESRIRWAGLSPDDFLFYTSYENSRYCKPNPGYYQEILDRLQARPQECLMVGNDVQEDMAAAALGMRVFLLTGCLINKRQDDISAYPQGDFHQLLAFIRGGCRT